MWAFTCNDTPYGNTMIAVSKSKKTLYDYARKYIVKHEAEPPNEFSLKCRTCEDGEWAIEDADTGEIYGWLESGIKEIK